MHRNFVIITYLVVNWLQNGNTATIDSIHKSCSIDLNAVVECNTPQDSGSVGSVLDHSVNVPLDSHCKLRTGLCATCTRNSWIHSTCSEGAVRQKRSLWFLATELPSCSLFCRQNDNTDELSSPIFTSCVSPSSPVSIQLGGESVMVTWFEPVAVDGQGRKLHAVQISGDGKSGEMFEKGHHTIVYKATNDRGMSSFCSIQFEVKVATCSVPVISNGKRFCDNRKLIHGTQCSYTCNEGFNLHGFSGTFCQNNGEWNETIPICKKKTCQPLTKVTCTDNFYYGSLCTRQCNHTAGLSAGSPSSTYCMSSGQWDDALSDCVDTSPPVFSNCPAENIITYSLDGAQKQVFYDPVSATDNFGNVNVTLTSGPSSGSQFDIGKTAVSYTAVDDSGNKALCSFNVIVTVPGCSEPSFNDKHLLFTCTDGHNSSASCGIHCEDGYNIEGSNSMTCIAQSSLLPRLSWNASGGQPYCQKQHCPDLMPPVNGGLICDANSFGQFCRITCNSGFDFPRTIESHNNWLQCASNGDWRPYSRVHDCIAKITPDEMRLRAQLNFSTSGCLNEEDNNMLLKNFKKLIDNSTFYHNTNCSDIVKCSVKQLEGSCENVSRRKRDTIQLQETGMAEKQLYRSRRSETTFTVSWEFGVSYNCSSRGINECLVFHENVLYELKDKFLSMLNSGLIGGVGQGYMAQNDSFRFDYVHFDCPEGMLSVINTGSCAVCPAGTMFDASTDSCKDCPLGHYQDTPHSFSCKNCPEGTTTIIEGAWTLSQCIDQCPPGQISSKGIQPCFTCPSGSYQPSTGATSCLKCPIGTLTEGQGKVSSISCKSYDISVSGTKDLESLDTTGYLTDFTLTLWIKVRTLGHGLSVTIGGSEVSLNIDQQISVRLKSQQVMSASSVEVDIWTHLAISYQQTEKTLKLYKNGQELSKVVVAAVTTPAILESSKMAIHVKQESDVILRSIQLMDIQLSQSAIQQMSSTCSLSSEASTVISLDSMKETSGDGRIGVISPSSCDAVDECLNSPCNGHLCINTPTSYNCECQDGYSGTSCTVPPDFCTKNKCRNAATCTGGLSTYTCECREGYTGTLCEFIAVNGGYSEWTEWSSCSVTCGQGTAERTRLCDSPALEYGGKNCSGADRETKTCSLGNCLACSSSQLQLNYGNTRPECNGTETELFCRAQCNPGYFTSKRQLTSYTCIHGLWSPSERLLPCFRILAPESLSMTVSVNYSSHNCLSDKEEAVLKSAISGVVQSTHCTSLPECGRSVMVTPCSTIESKASLSLFFHIPLAVKNLDIDGYVKNGIVSPGLRSVFEALDSLEKTALQLQNNSTRILEVIVDGVQFTPDYPPTIDTTIVCPKGSFPEDGFCGECPPGTYYQDNTKSCNVCGKGFYQDRPGQTQCTRCPVGQTTMYIGSPLSSDCSEPTEIETTTHNIRLTVPNPTNTTAIIVGCVVGILLIGVVIAVFVIVRNLRRKRHLENYDKPARFVNENSVPFSNYERLHGHVGPSVRSAEAVGHNQNQESEAIYAEIPEEQLHPHLSNDHIQTDRNVQIEAHSGNSGDPFLWSKALVENLPPKNGNELTISETAVPGSYMCMVANANISKTRSAEVAEDKKNEESSPKNEDELTNSETAVPGSYICMVANAKISKSSSAEEGEDKNNENSSCVGLMNPTIGNGQEGSIGNLSFDSGSSDAQSFASVIAATNASKSCESEKETFEGINSIY